MALAFVYGAAAGSTPPAASIQSDSRDDQIMIICGTGSATTTGTYGTVSFAGNDSSVFSALPKITITGLGPFAPAAQFYAATIATNGFTIGSVNVPAASKAAGMGGFGVLVVHVDF